MICLPEPIRDFLAEHHVLSLAVCIGNRPWAANAFFAFDEPRVRLLFLSSTDTRHGEMLQANRHVAGTIAGQPLAIPQVRGLQFYGSVRVLGQNHERQSALGLYYARFPQAHGLSAPLWEIRLQHLKFTDNRQGFGSKLLWDRSGGVPVGK